MNKQSGLADRIKKALADAKMTQRKLAEILTVAEATVSTYTTGVSEPPIKSLAVIAKKCNVSLDWLITGEDGKNAYSTASAENGTINETAAKYHPNPDLKLIKQIIQAAMEHLVDNRLTMPPDKFAELIDVLYEEMTEAGVKQVNKGTVSRLIKLAR